MINKKLDKEAKRLVKFLKHPAGFDIDVCGMLGIRPTDKNSPPTAWEVNWEDLEGKEHYKAFDNLYDAAYFFAEKRYHLSYGLDYERKKIIKHEQ